MNPARVFAMGVANSDHASVGRSTGGAEITPAIAAGMCSGMPQLWYHAARLKWADDWSGANDLEYHLWVKAVDICTQEGWKVPPGREYLRRMAGLAIAEVALPSKFTGDVQRAEFLGMDKSRFCRVWKKRYWKVYQVLDELTSCAYRHVLKNNVDIGATVI